MATDRGVARARKWLRGHRLGDVEPSELLVARLEARRRGNRIHIAAVVAFIMIMGVWRWIDRSAPDENTVSGIGLSAFMYAMVIVALCLGWWYQDRAERHLLSLMRIRSAHPAATSVRDVLGPAHLVAVTVVFGGGLLLGAAGALLAPRPSDRVLALTFLVAVAVLAALGCLALVTVLRRPTVAEDAESILVDDVLRTQDARFALIPLPILVALATAGGTTTGSWMAWALLAYTAVGAACWLSAELLAGLRAPRGLAAAR
jgi:hypothetical protein